MIIRRFKLDQSLINSLSDQNQKILKILMSCVEATAKVYQIQRNEGFYPKDATKKQIKQAGKKDPDILSPFTFIQIDGNSLRAIPYHVKFKDLLLPISEKIGIAAKLCTDKAFKKYLELRAKSLLDGSYKDADIAWLNVLDFPIDFSIGPFERYLDKILFLKRSFQAHVGLIDQEKTEIAQKIKETLYSSAKLSSSEQHSTQIPQKGVNVFVERTPVTSGYMADVVFSGEHFPCDLEVMEEYGSRILVYSSQLKLKFEKLYYPIFQAIFEKRFASKYSKELLLKATGWNVLLYELGRQLHKFSGARERLQELYGPIDEANKFASGIQHSKHLLVKGLLTQDELEAIIIIHIVWMFADWLIYKYNKGVENYVIADSMGLNMYLANGALKEQDGVSWPNFSKIFFEIEALADKLVWILHKGSYQEADKFIKDYAQLNNFDRIAKRLSKIHPAI